MLACRNNNEMWGKYMKYKLTDETIEHNGHTLHRIQYLLTGELGGWIESEDNFSQEGNAIIFDDAKVYGNAKVYGDALVYDEAQVFDNAKVFDNAVVCCSAIVRGDEEVCGETVVLS